MKHSEANHSDANRAQSISVPNGRPLIAQKTSTYNPRKWYIKLMRRFDFHSDNFIRKKHDRTEQIETAESLFSRQTE